MFTSILALILSPMQAGDLPAGKRSGHHQTRFITQSGLDLICFLGSTVFNGKTVSNTKTCTEPVEVTRRSRRKNTRKFRAFFPFVPFVVRLFPANYGRAVF